MTNKYRKCRKLCRQIIILLVMLCQLAAPVMAAANTDKAAADKTVIKKAAAKNSFDADAPELTLEASESIDKGLKFLLSTQHKDGSWDDDGKGGHAVAITSLGLMAFMSKAQFPGSGPYGVQLDRAKEFLLNQAKKGVEGYLGTVMYEHGLATLALSEMWGMTWDEKDDARIQKALEAAVDVILRSQTPVGGWRYQPQRDGGQDTSVTVMIFVALASARQAGVMVPNETITKVVTYFKRAWNAPTGGFSYSWMGEKGPSLACSAGGAYAAQLAGMRDTEIVSACLRYLEQLAPGVFSGGLNYYAHYYAVQAMVQAGDERYAAWYPQIRDALISQQQSNGSWGKSYQTPMAIITLATPHRYIPIYQR